MQKDTNIKKMAEIEETIERKIAEEELNKKRAVEAVNKKKANFVLKNKDFDKKK